MLANGRWDFISAFKGLINGSFFIKSLQLLTLKVCGTLRLGLV
jgi:hypothetical protein